MHACSLIGPDCPMAYTSEGQLSLIPIHIPLVPLDLSGGGLEKIIPCHL